MIWIPNVVLDFKPTKQQKEFLNSEAKECLYGGSAGGGKSYILRWTPYIRSLKIPGHKSLILRKTYADLEISQIRASLEEFSREVGRYIDNKKRWEFINGSIIDFGYLDAENDVYKYQSAEYEYIGFDELTHFTENQYTYLLSRLRTNKPNVQPIMRAATNPGGIGHNWVKARFIDPVEPYEVWKPERGGTRQFIPASVWDNPYINQEDYVENLMALPENTRRALLDGDWNVFGGPVYKEFDPKIHVLTPFSIPNHWPKYSGADWGFAKPFAFLWGAVAQENYNVGNRIIPKGSVVIYREYYGCQKGKVDTGIEMNAREVAWNVIDMENEIVNVRVIDPATWSRRGHDGPPIAEIFIDEGLYVTRADNNRLAGKMQIHDRLRVDDKTGEPSLFILNNCRHLIRTLPALPADPRNPEDVDTKSEDHLFDALKYLLMARPTRKKKYKKRKQTRNKYTGY